MANATRPWLGWYKLARWRKRREAQLARQPLCERCLARDETVEAATVAHHKVAHKGKPDLFWYGELESLCKPCHDSAGQLEDHGKRVMRFDEKGWPI